MPVVVVVGGQWGDEGKGRIVDLLARKARVVARYSAGNNAGHTIVNDLGEFKLHLVPAGIFYPEKTCLIGNGVAVDPEVLLDEISQLDSRGIDTSKLWVSARAQVVMPWHRLIDRLDEERLGADAIGTTGKGIGPCFTDKVARRGIRIVDLLEPEDLRARMRSVVEYQNAVITRRLRRGADRLRGVLRAVQGSTASGCNRSSRIRRRSSWTRCARATTCCSRGRKARSWTWTTAPTST